MGMRDQRALDRHVVGLRGLDAPTVEITIARADGTEIATVLVGKQEGGRAFVRTKAAPAVYAVDAGQLGTLPKGPDDFKG